MKPNPSLQKPHPNRFSIDLGTDPKAALQHANTTLGLALSDLEIDYLVNSYAKLRQTQRCRTLDVLVPLGIVDMYFNADGPLMEKIITLFHDQEYTCRITVWRAECVFG